MRGLYILLIGTLVTSLSLFGCGGDSSENESPGETDPSGETDGNGDDTDPESIDTAPEEFVLEEFELACVGRPETGDVDGDGMCNDVDDCPFDNPDDADDDGRCDSETLVGETCADPIILEPYVAITEETGVPPATSIRFKNLWANDHDFTSTTDCNDDPADVWDEEFVIQVEMTAGQVLDLVTSQNTTTGRKMGVRVLDACDAALGRCLANETETGDSHFSFTAPSAGTYYLVIENDDDASGPDQYYDLDLVLRDDTESDCEDGFDNNADGFTDCQDPACHSDSSCNTVELYHEPFDVDDTSSWKVSTNGPWSWSNSNNPTGSTGGYLSLVANGAVDESYWVELDLTGIDLSAFANIFLQMWHTYPSYGSFRAPMVQASFDDGDTWEQVANNFDFAGFNRKEAAMDLFDLGPAMEGRSGVRLRIAAHKDCATSYNPSNCAGSSDSMDWQIDELSILAWGAHGSGAVTGQVDTSVDFSTTENITVTPTAASGSGVTCAGARSAPYMGYDAIVGDDFVNRETLTPWGCEPNTEGFDPQHDWNDNLGCGYYINGSLAAAQEVSGPEYIYSAYMKAGERLWVSNDTGMPAIFFVLRGGCDPTASEPVCVESYHAEFDGYFEYEAPSDGTHYLVFKSVPRDPCAQAGMMVNSTVDYNLNIGHFAASEVDCTDGQDNDGDYLVDCDDPNCFESCSRTPVFSELFTDGVPDNFHILGLEGDTWKWCNGIAGECTHSSSSSGPDRNRFSDSGGGYMLLFDNNYASGSSVTTPAIDVSGHGGDHLGLSFALRYAGSSKYKMYAEIIADGQLVAGRGQENEIVIDSGFRGGKFVDLSSFVDVTTVQSVKIRFLVDVPAALKTDPWRLDDLMLVSWTE